MQPELLYKVSSFSFFVVVFLPFVFREFSCLDSRSQFSPFLYIAREERGFLHLLMLSKLHCALPLVPLAFA
jgi:hypothetical protein